MAKASSTNTKVTKTITVEEKVVTLELSEFEANVLRGILGKVGGYDADNDGLVRHTSDGIYNALGKSGVRGFLSNTQMMYVEANAEITSSGYLS